MDLKTNYLGFELENPFMPGSSPMLDNLDSAKKLEDAGASALVMRSLFEEQIIAEERTTQAVLDEHTDTYAEALSFFPKTDSYAFGPHEYLAQVRKIKEAVSIPVIASLNGVTPGRWIEYSKLIEQAGADALELNVFHIPTDPETTADKVEWLTLELVRAVKKAVQLPVAVKLSPYYSALANFARELENAGADGLVLFNRFYQPDIDVNSLGVKPDLKLSSSDELLLRLRWLAILSPTLKASLAVSGGVHTAIDATKAIMAGAHAVQLVSCLLGGGPLYLGALREELANWLDMKGYDSLKQMQGSLNVANSPDTDAYQRANYLHVLQTWKK